MILAQALVRSIFMASPVSPPADVAPATTSAPVAKHTGYMASSSHGIVEPSGPRSRGSGHSARSDPRQDGRLLPRAPVLLDFEEGTQSAVERGGSTGNQCGLKDFK